MDFVVVGSSASGTIEPHLAAIGAGRSVAAAAAASTQAAHTSATTASHAAAAAAAASNAAASSGAAAAAAAAAAAHSSLGEHGPILYTEPNRTPAIEDLRSVVIYIFIIAIFSCFFLILPGIRNEKFPTFLCITPSLIVTSIILLSLYGTTWHVAEAPISAAYKAFSRDRIQGELSVKIGLQSVNITLRAHKYYILHATHGPIIMDNTPFLGSHWSFASSSINNREDDFTTSTMPPTTTTTTASSKLVAVDEGADLDNEEDEPFIETSARRARSSNTTTTSSSRRNARQTTTTTGATRNRRTQSGDIIKRVNMDINYNERFYWIEPNQMRREHHAALERGLPYPILTVVEYLSQDDAGFNWSRQYRQAGYYAYISLWLAMCLCVVMFFLHCAAPLYGVYMMQFIGCIMLSTNLTYATLVPRGEQKLVIPFEGQSLTFKFGWHFWLLCMGGCLSLGAGTLIVIIDMLFPNFILTTILDASLDAQSYEQRKRIAAQRASSKRSSNSTTTPAIEAPPQQQQQRTPEYLRRPARPPFMNDAKSPTHTSVSPDSAAATIKRRRGSRNGAEPLATDSADSRQQLQQQRNRKASSVGIEIDAAAKRWPVQVAPLAVTNKNSTAANLKSTHQLARNVSSASAGSSSSSSSVSHVRL